MRRLPLVRDMLIAVVGFNSPFPSLKEAGAAIRNYEGGGHCDADYYKIHLTFVEKARPSDYAALFHIRLLLPGIRSIFDFGGSVGNLFYCYSKYLDLPSDLSWTVFDLPRTIQIGEQMARERNEGRLRFTDRLGDADGIDLFIASGSLHYFERPLADMIAEFRRRPRYVLVNRTPLIDGPAFATVQDGSTWLVACMLYNRDELIRAFATIGYDTVDRWQVPEYSIIIPCYLDRSVRAYSGMLFRLRDMPP